MLGVPRDASQRAYVERRTGAPAHAGASTHRGTVRRVAGSPAHRPGPGARRTWQGGFAGSGRDGFTIRPLIAKEVAVGARGVRGLSVPWQSPDSVAGVQQFRNMRHVTLPTSHGFRVDWLARLPETRTADGSSRFFKIFGHRRHADPCRQVHCDLRRPGNDFLVTDSTDGLVISVTPAFHQTIAVSYHQVDVFEVVRVTLHFFVEGLHPQ